ncbi:MAG: SixA phosphatase family protein [Elusimicrobiota bacterium]
MEIYLMRHAEAVPEFTWDGPDSTRPLSKQGKKALMAAVSSFVKANFQPKCIVYSTHVRTTQTAEIMKGIVPGVSVFAHSEIASGARVDKFIQLMQQYKLMAPILFVGHMPDVAMAAARLIPDPYLLEKRFEPAEIMAVKITNWENPLMMGQFLWSKTLNQW